MDKPQGLSSLEAESQFRTFGPNEIIPSKLENRLSEVKQLLLDPMGLMLLCLGGIYFALGDRSDAIVLFLAYIPVTAVDVILNLKANKALQALKQTLKKTAKVIRDGIIQEVPIRKIVAGDVIVFEEGQSIPADGSIIESHLLQMDESALTGESVPVEKDKGSAFYGGTVVLHGRGIGFVKTIGKATQFGKVATLLKETNKVKSPLQIKLNYLIKRVFITALFLAIFLFFLQYFRSNHFLSSLLVALTFAMAIVPEEFPMVFTLYLSMGAWRLSKVGVLIKSLPSVETLGSVDVICTDKTGTLTEGHFQLEQLISFDPNLETNRLWQYAMMACEEHPIDAMESAIFQKGEPYKALLKDWNLKWDYSFEVEGKHMSHVWYNSTTKQHVMAMKGAIEGVFEHCEINTDQKQNILEKVDLLASLGKRLLAFAYRQGTFVGERKKDELGLTFAGLLVFSDPIRSSAKNAIAACQSANIEIKMLTGDHPLTAHAVADQTGIIHEHDQLFSGDQLTKMTKEHRFSAYMKGVIFSRVLPEQKHEMVQALRSFGKVVAMTGDGINDAPALKLADIGISMGSSATDVARSSAQLILLENNFNGIVEAVFEGRRIFSNLKRSFSYLISFHVPVVLLAFLPPVFGWGDLLMPIHIVLLQLIVHPVSAFAFENLGINVVTSKKNLMTKRRLFETLLSGTLLSIFCLILYRYTLSVFDVSAARTVGLVSILMGNIVFVIVESWPFRSRRLLFILLCLLTLTFAVVWIPFIRQILHLTEIHLHLIAIAVSMGIVSSIPTFLLRLRRTSS